MRSVLGHEQDTIPPDHREYGWLTLTRATRQLAHHFGVIPLDRVLAPLPASRAEARREVDPLLDGIVLARRNAGAPEPAGPSAPAPGPPDPTPDLPSEINRLLADARASFATAPSDFTLVAIPSNLDPEGNGARLQRCADESPDAGQIRDGVFYWPFRSVASLGAVTIDTLGRFAFLAFDRDWLASEAFSKFCGRAAAALLAAVPPWFGPARPGPGTTTWAATIMFLSPSARTQTAGRPNGVRILSNPWAASIAALRDILSPPVPAPPSPPPSREVPVWDSTARVLRFRSEECKRFKRPAPDQEKVLAAFQEEGWPDAIDDPLTGGKLATTVESLNDRLKHIKFGLNGAGTGVCWAPR